MSKKVFKDKALQDQMKVNIKYFFRKKYFLNKNDFEWKCFNYYNTRPGFYIRMFKGTVKEK